jgi:hypothetical protein
VIHVSKNGCSLLLLHQMLLGLLLGLLLSLLVVMRL